MTTSQTANTSAIIGNNHIAPNRSLSVKVGGSSESGQYSQLIDHNFRFFTRSQFGFGRRVNGRARSSGFGVLWPHFTTVVSVLGVISVVASTGCSKSANAASETHSQANVQPLRIDTQPVTARSVPLWIPLTGQLKGSRDADLAANAVGKVVKTLVERGDLVKPGQPLAVLDTRAASLNLAEARASAESALAAAENAKSNCERFRTLADQGAISQVEYDSQSIRCKTSDFTVSAARARAALAGQFVGDGVIRAPFAGSIAERYVDVGEYVRADSRVVTLVDLSTLRLEFTLPEGQIRAIRAGAKVRFNVAGYPDKKFDGTVKYIGAQVRPTTRDVIAEAVIDTPDVDLRPGMFAAVELFVGNQTAPVIPRKSLIEQGGRFVAFVAVEGRLEERIIQVGESIGQDVAVTRGIELGEHLVVAPSRELKNGQRVL
jgi:RND family efflux transporter MFP subunit